MRKSAGERSDVFDAGIDEVIYRELRQRILDRRYQPGRPLSVAEVAGDLQAEPAPIYYALAKLAGEALVSRVGVDTHELVPIDVIAAEATFDARCAIELGAVEISRQRTTTTQIEELRRRLTGMLPLIRADRFVDFERYLDANNAFHEQVVRLADNEALLIAYRRLAVRAVMAHTLRATNRTSNAMLDDHVRIADAIISGDMQETRSALLDHCEHAKARARIALAAAGGTI
ncbi:DNA-binding GntR family transcriptional regulator [Kribbella sp. VKM Ac-2566]|nr:DNA-binding GntR family transcriptional regulator [Kribbella sp. VKM Ac-2566]